jgi:hypothetical protein
MIKPTITICPIVILAALGAQVFDPDCAVADWKVPDRAPLLTPWASEVSPANALPEYPRPTLVRAAWQNLNGLWEYAVTDKNRTTVPSQFDGQILVPFCIESALSGVMLPLKPDQRLWYRRNFAVPKQWQGQRILPHFGAEDWQTTVYLNGRELGSHRGGYDPFTFDVTGTLEPGESQELLVAVWDPTDTSWQLRGKQVLHPGGAAYTACSGIWQTVWLEPVPQASVESLHVVSDLAANRLKLPRATRLSAWRIASPVRTSTSRISPAPPATRPCSRTRTARPTP